MKLYFQYFTVWPAITLFSIAALFSCSGSSSQKQNTEIKKTDTLPVVYKKPPSGFNDTLVIDSRSAVFYNPDSLQLEKMKAVIKKEEYETEVHNCFYMMRNARIVLKKYWAGIKIIETSKNRFLLFRKANGHKICIDLNMKGDICGIFLFDTKKDPEFIDMMNVDTALGFYFEK